MPTEGRSFLVHKILLEFHRKTVLQSSLKNCSQWRPIFKSKNNFILKLENASRLLIQSNPTVLKLQHAKLFWKTSSMPVFSLTAAPEMEAAFTHAHAHTRTVWRWCGGMSWALMASVDLVCFWVNYPFNFSWGIYSFLINYIWKSAFHRCHSGYFDFSVLFLPKVKFTGSEIPQKKMEHLP